MAPALSALSGAARAVACTAALLAVSNAALADVLLYRGAHVYVVPDALATRMLELDGRGAWTHFPKFTRHIDSDADGAPDQVAIGLGSEAGYGAQVRYRVYPPGESGGGEERLGLWTWGVVTGPGGERLLEVFNP